MWEKIYNPFLNGKHKSAPMYDCNYLKKCVYIHRQSLKNKMESSYYSRSGITDACALKNNLIAHRVFLLWVGQVPMSVSISNECPTHIFNRLRTDKVARIGNGARRPDKPLKALWLGFKGPYHFKFPRRSKQNYRYSDLRRRKKRMNQGKNHFYRVCKTASFDGFSYHIKKYSMQQAMYKNMENFTILKRV